MAIVNVALAGNPNTGKTTLFNALTGNQYHVGNWPGVTVEKRQGEWQFEGHTYNVVDLPGVYSLSAFSPEEVITRHHILQDKPDVIVLVVDASNLERNLYLVVQVLEMKIPTILALNMTDTAQARGLHINSDLLAQRLGIPVVPTVARKASGLEALKAMIAAIALGRTTEALASP